MVNPPNAAPGSPSFDPLAAKASDRAVSAPTITNTQSMPTTDWYALGAKVEIFSGKNGNRFFHAS